MDRPTRPLCGSGGGRAVNTSGCSTNCRNAISRRFFPIRSPAKRRRCSNSFSKISSIAHREPAHVENGQGKPSEPRISFLACPGIRREAEIVANEIWSIVRSNEKLAAEGNAERIRFHEIAVLIPDSAVDDYVAQIESVFRKQHRIPIDLVSRSHRRRESRRRSRRLAACSCRRAASRAPR